MTYVSIFTDKVNTTPRTEVGCKGHIFPTTNKTENHMVFQGCAGCAKLASHDRPCSMIGLTPNLSERHYDVPSTNQITAEDLMKLQSALYVTNYIINGVPDGTLYNLGAGSNNNISQQTTYKIISASGNTLTLEGRNPKLINSPISILNSNYPFAADDSLKPDDVTQEEWDGTPGLTDGIKYGKTIPSGIYHCLPVGSKILFAHPSCLFGKLQPYIVNVNPPASTELEDVQFSVYCSCDVSNADSPIDLEYPAEDYYCTIYYYAVAPEKWGNFQSVPEDYFTKKTKEYTAEEFYATEGTVTLKNSNDVDSIVLMPSMGSPAMRVRYQRTGQAPTFYNITDAKVNITVGGVTTVDLADVYQYIDLEWVKIDYCPLAINDDTYKIPFPATCSNDQVDYTDSYTMASGRRCMNVNCQKYKDGDYSPGECWQTANADEFVLGNETGNFPISEFQDSDYLSRLWSRCSFKISQGVVGVSAYRNFFYERPTYGGPSIQELVGGFLDETPSGKHPTNYPLFEAAFGQYMTYTNESDEDDHKIIKGTFEQKYNSDPIDGYCYGNISGWNSRDDYQGNNLTSTTLNYPLNGPGYCHLYTYATSSSAFGLPKRISTISNNVHLTGLNKNLNLPINTTIRTLI